MLSDIYIIRLEKLYILLKKQSHFYVVLQCIFLNTSLLEEERVLLKITCFHFTFCLLLPWHMTVCAKTCFAFFLETVLPGTW